VNPFLAGLLHIADEFLKIYKVRIGHELVFDWRDNKCHSDILWLLKHDNERKMHIVVIAWLWVILMMSITASSVTGGVLTFVFLGIAPCALLLWLFGGAGRRSRKRRIIPNTPEQVSVVMAHEHVDTPDRENTQTDQGKLRD